MIEDIFNVKIESIFQIVKTCGSFQASLKWLLSNVPFTKTKGFFGHKILNDMHEFRKWLKVFIQRLKDENLRVIFIGNDILFLK